MRSIFSEFDNIPETLKDKRVDEVDRTPAENLAYQVGWTTLVLKWEEGEKKGSHVKTPSDEFKWNQLGELYQWFTDTYAHLSLQELKVKLHDNVNSIYGMIDLLSEEELFKPHMRQWLMKRLKQQYGNYFFLFLKLIPEFLMIGDFLNSLLKFLFIFR